ncbi:6-phosphogluconate dehydrogenase [Nocardioides sp. KC13]|uniref:6-phosphogluconate dehydrogenase n=1 Tax=Nocardioides turkmenicus TaxID=2711220 RepID=A0A6M1QXF3_9ACTN|nr:nuclear transport factor 2 family protein [Nocardioides sp. KC13]NGN94673.1 6-phosphogluconate dehydrogenase [Nocardioides sp. KC13]
MSTRVAVVGLGRMGTAMESRLREKTYEVAGWSRRHGGSPQTAVADADVVVLALFDGHACAQVLDQITLKSGAVLVNTSTIAPDEAAALSERVGPAYVHAPVLGSVPAVADGSLTVLAAGAEVARVRGVLTALGDVVEVAEAATAAALKLVANSSLAGALLALRDSLQQADALGLPRSDTLDVLARGPLGGLVSRKRPFLDGTDSSPAAQFTIGALAKDATLLADATQVPFPTADVLGNSQAGPDADIGLVATEASVDDAVLRPLRAYVEGHATGDPTHFGDAFLPSAHIEGLRDDGFVTWTLDEYVGLFPGRPAADESTRRRRIDSVQVHGTVATASMTLWHGTDTFTDVFLLVDTGGRWWIANKAYHRDRTP